ncbi:snake venom serine protease homolog [Astatotilapia calliptera]|uniref:snake venom serine protease homolog n=1 Tax=Astatotilapia calliptera TaxID=8154 RepID=UPI000E41125C|nr:snake venom serine protease homolog [Astatotilapia calliptera]
MLLELSEPLTGIQPVALPDCNNPPKKGDVVQVAGLGGYRVNATGHTHVPYNNRLCLKEPNVDTRKGDSGGGVIYNNMIYGVISGSGECTHTVKMQKGFLIRHATNQLQGMNMINFMNQS